MKLGPLSPSQHEFWENIRKAEEVKRSMRRCEYCKSLQNIMKTFKCSQCGAPMLTGVVDD